MKRYVLNPERGKRVCIDGQIINEGVVLTGSHWDKYASTSPRHKRGAILISLAEFERMKSSDDNHTDNSHVSKDKSSEEKVLDEKAKQDLAEAEKRRAAIQQYMQEKKKAKESQEIEIEEGSSVSDEGIEEEELDEEELKKGVDVLSRGEVIELFSSIKGLGKVSAAKLYDAGVRSLQKLADSNSEELSEIVGGKWFTAEKAESVISKARTKIITDGMLTDR